MCNNYLFFITIALETTLYSYIYALGLVVLTQLYWLTPNQVLVNLV